MSGTNNSEVSKKLRAAIRAKLEELGVYVDDELPDYIMVMIANKKEKKQMKDDLSLFLSKNTEKFVDWLFDIFERLQSAPKPASPPPQAVHLSKESTKEKKESSSASLFAKEAISNVPSKQESKNDRKRIEAPRESGREREKERGDKASKPREEERERISKSREEERERAHRVKEEERERERAVRSREEEKERLRKRRSEDESRQREKERERHRAISPPGRKKSRLNSTSDRHREERRNEKRVPGQEEKRRRQKRVEAEEGEEGGREDEACKKVASMVVAPRMRSRSPLKVSSQIVVKRKIDDNKDVKAAKATTNMFMRAMNAASISAGYGSAAPFPPKAVAKKKAVVQSENQKKALKELLSSDEKFANGEDEEEEEEPPVRKAPAPLRKRNAPNDHKESSPPIKKISKEPKFIITLKGGGQVTREESAEKKESEDEGGTIRVISPRKKAEKGEMKAEAPPRKSMDWDGHIRLNDEDDSDSSDDEAAIDEVLAATRINRVSSIEEETLPPTRHLSRGSSYVALPLVSLPQPYPTYIPTPLSQQNKNAATAVAPSMAARPNKIMERCRFWPNCKQETACIYIHPIKNCLNFPKCHFGANCIYIHPQCKFDQNCTNPSCPFTHSAKGLGMPPAAAPTPPMSAAAVNTEKKLEPDVPLSASPPTLQSYTPCRFGAGCTKPGCQFKHPMECRYGQGCLNAHCKFFHPTRATAAVMPTAPPPALKGAKYKWTASAAPVST